MSMIPPETADIIVCGGGGGGCVVAAQLAEKFPDLTVLLIERGGDNKEYKRLDKPLDSLFWLFQEHPFLHWIESAPQAQLGGRVSRIPVGNILGGGTSVNTLMHNSAAASDFDDWDQPGWSWAEVEHLARSTVMNRSIDSGIDIADRRFEVSNGGHNMSWSKTFHEAFDSVRSIPYVESITDYKTCHGVGPWPKLIDSHGLRSSTANTWIHRSTAPNLQVLTHTSVSRIIIEDGTAKGVEIYPSSSDSPSYRTVRANKQVILCCGTIGTPGILERSGVGDPAILGAAGIEVKVDLPGVGAELDDHQLTVYSYHASDDLEGDFDAYARGDPGVKEAADAEWISTGKGIVASNGFDYGFKIRPTQEDLAQMGERTAAYWRSIEKPDKALYQGTFIPYFYANQQRPPTGKFMSFGGFNMYPASRGNVHITSSDPLAPQRINVGLLTDPVDMPQHVWMYKIQREVYRRLPWFVAEHAGSHPDFPPGSAAAVPSKKGVPGEPFVNIEYTEDDDRAIEEYITNNIATAYHTVSTCPLRSREKKGVVDPDLNVYGVKGLKIADISVVPRNVGTNTTGVVLIIAHKAVEIITRELQLSSA